MRETKTPTLPHAPRCHLEQSRPRFRVGVRLALLRLAAKVRQAQKDTGGEVETRRATAYAVGSRGA